MKPGKYVMVTNECGALDIIKEKFDNINIVEYGIVKHVTGRDGIGFLIISNTSQTYVMLKT